MGGSGQLPVLLKVSGLNFRYHSRQGPSSEWDIQNLSLQVAAGEIVCILGPSGCGKTTLLNLIAGLLKPVKGTVEITRRSEFASSTGYIFQQDALFPWRTVLRNLMLAREMTFNDAKEEALVRIKQYLSVFHLTEDICSKFPGELSGGMRQRVSIIQSLMFNPELLLLDEPFSALDFFTRLKLESEFYELIKQNGKGAILVTHDIEEAVAMSDRVLVMTKGGTITRQFDIGVFGSWRSPETVRGTAQFAEMYRAIWEELQSVVAG